MSRLLNKFLFWWFAGVLASINVFALPDDWQQEMTIFSDTAEIDRKSGVVVYQGDVILTQGSMKIESDRLIILRNGEVLEKATALGKEDQPARYQQQINEGEGLTKAHGQRIDYFAERREVLLQDNAQLEQDGNTFSGDRILYDMDKEVVSAGGAVQNTQPANEVDGETPRQRIKVVIQPQQEEASDADIERPDIESSAP